MFSKKRSLAIFCSALCVSTATLTSAAQACTRFVYHGTGDAIIAARSMDWKTDVGTNLWVFPRGMNEKGLVANILWLVESSYPNYDGTTPGLSIAAWVQ